MLGERRSADLFGVCEVSGIKKSKCAGEREEQEQGIELSSEGQETGEGEFRTEKSGLGQKEKMGETERLTEEVSTVEQPRNVSPSAEQPWQKIQPGASATGPSAPVMEWEEGDVVRGPLHQENHAPRSRDLFFTPQDDSRDFSSVLKEVQEYISSKYSTLIVEQGNEEVKEQIKRYITKYIQDYRIAVTGMTGQELVDAIYTEMAEFSFLTKYVFGTGIEEIDSATRS